MLKNTVHLKLKVNNRNLLKHTVYYNFTLNL